MNDHSPPSPQEHEPEPESVVYVRVLPSPEPEWQARVGSVAWLMALVTGAALAVALGTYQLGLVLNRMIQGLLGE
jgi:hypothetical protein